MRTGVLKSTLVLGVVCGAAIFLWFISSYPLHLQPRQGRKELMVMGISPHCATYTISLEQVSDPTIVDATGSMVVQVVDGGEGWAVIQKSTLTIYEADGDFEEITTNHSTWEAKDGLSYRFDIWVSREGQKDEAVTGMASLKAEGEEGTAFYELPEKLTVSLPAGTVFPMQHLLLTWQAAVQGKKVLNHKIFDGGNEVRDVVGVDTVLGKDKKPQLSTIKNHEKLSSIKMWPMQMGIYPKDSDDPEPDYQIEQQVLDPGGIIQEMVLDYGSFRIRAVLTEIDFSP